MFFEDNVNSLSEISLILFTWSITTFIFELPTGIWADVFSRKKLIVFSRLLKAGGIAIWFVHPFLLGFILGAILWGLSTALESGAFSALIYDELEVQNSVRLFSRINGMMFASGIFAGLVANASSAFVLYHFDSYNFL